MAPSTDAEPVLLALTTEADAGKAEALAEALLKRGLAACVALTPTSALYRWQGQLERSAEVQVLIKARPEQLAELESAVHALHSYDTPQWLHWRAGASPAYAAWVAAS